MNIGVFVDAENVSYVDLPYIMMEIKKFGRVIVNRLYADWSSPIVEKWKPHLVQYAMEPVHCAKLPKKNSVDIKMIDDIYDVLYFKKTVDIYILVTNDIDYLTCCRKIQLFGKHLYVFGYNNCSEVLKNICDKFVNISLLNTKQDEQEKKEHIELDNVFDGIEIVTRNTGEKFVDTIFEVLNGSRHIQLAVLEEKLKTCGYDADLEKEVTKYENYFTIGGEGSKRKLYDITAINSEVHSTIYEQVEAMYCMNESDEIIMPVFKDKMEKITNNFDQRLWGFNRMKDLIVIIFKGKLEIIDRGSSQYIKNLM